MKRKQLLILILIFIGGVSLPSAYLYNSQNQSKWVPPKKFTLYVGQVMGDPPTAYLHRSDKSTWMIAVEEIAIMVNSATLTFEASEIQWIILWSVSYMVISVTSQGVEAEPYTPEDIYFKVT